MGHEGSYEVSSLGRARSLDREVSGRSGCVVRRRGIVLALYIDRDGYASFSLGGGGGAPAKVHIEMLAAFVGPRPDGFACRHLDGNPGNNHLDNLRYGTAKENKADAMRHGTAIRGEACPGAVLDNATAASLHSRLNGGEFPSALAREFGVSVQSVIRVGTGETWSHVTGGEAVSRRRFYGDNPASSARLTVEQAIEIHGRLAAGESQRPLAREFGVSKPTIMRIGHGVTWTKFTGGAASGPDSAY